ncbi:hypothetical protein [Pedobacter sp. MC2016-24]|uniref:hypothetical protein n=1 Tax=Pedobacter sp. MC2016-24 TaxID=2780090 RepID=UPI001880443E|nr:hypothetical protein [Pedobacter sp. MC2016-24]MBE9602668.1 hypothetical protein [Pedobacter sp. MC2016-24]
MKVTNVTKYKVTMELSLHELYRISEALGAVTSQYQVLDKKDLNVAKEVYEEVEEDLCEILVYIVDDKTLELIRT